MSTTQTAAAATYTKLNDGTWGVRVAGRTTVGASITVSKRDGSRKTETVGAVLWTGIARDGREASLVTIASSGHRSSRRMGAGHGSAPSVGGYSSYCTANDHCRCYDCAS